MVTASGTTEFRMNAGRFLKGIVLHLQGQVGDFIVVHIQNDCFSSRLKFLAELPTVFFLTNGLCGNLTAVPIHQSWV